MNIVATYFDSFDNPAPTGLRSTGRMREDFRYGTRWWFLRYKTFKTMMVFMATARALMRRILKVEAENLNILLMWQLQKDAEMRARVRDDLGGEAALDKWEVRFAKVRETVLAQEKESEDFETNDANNEKQTPHVNRPESTPTKVSAPKTDRTGLYRLAPVPRCMRRMEKAKRAGVTCKLQSGPRFLYRFKPLPLHPIALRETDRPKDEEITDADTLLVRSGLPGARLLWAMPEPEPHKPRNADPPSGEWHYLGRDIFFC